MENKDHKNLHSIGANFFKFDKMITPDIIQIIFYMGIGFFILLGLITTMQSNIVAGLFVTIVGALMTRISAEGVIVIFKIHEALQDIRRR